GKSEYKLHLPAPNEKLSQQGVRATTPGLGVLRPLHPQEQHRNLSGPQHVVNTPIRR
ncbi:hypothetical protein BGZ88_006388, partial [Linnemannia elongata]